MKTSLRRLQLGIFFLHFLFLCQFQDSTCQNSTTRNQHSPSKTNRNAFVRLYRQRHWPRNPSPNQRSSSNLPNFSNRNATALSSRKSLRNETKPPQSFAQPNVRLRLKTNDSNHLITRNRPRNQLLTPEQLRNLHPVFKRPLATGYFNQTQLLDLLRQIKNDRPDQLTRRINIQNRNINIRNQKTSESDCEIASNRK